MRCYRNSEALSNSERRSIRNSCAHAQTHSIVTSATRKECARAFWHRDVRVRSLHRGRYSRRSPSEENMASRCE